MFACRGRARPCPCQKVKDSSRKGGRDDKVLSVHNSNRIKASPSSSNSPVSTNPAEENSFLPI